MNAQPALHPTDQTLQSYGLGKLDDASAGSVHAHLEGCPSCRRRVAEVSSDSFLGRLRGAGVQPPSQGPAVSATDGLSMLDGAAARPAPPPASTLPPGLADHPDYEVLGELGRGGMGVVYLARNTLMGRLEVLKVVGGDLVSKPAILERFLREIRSAAQLHHPNIVTAYSAMRLGESLVLAMEYVEGCDLARRVKEKGPLPVAHACYFVHQAALGLQHAHEHGMVHRDIKPANLILAIAGKKAVVKVLDFGLAKVTSEGQRDTGLTREGQMLGTPDYIAPEQIRDAQKADIRADIYSLGCTLYYLLTGGPPFGGDNLWDLYQAHFSMDASPLNLVRPEVPVEVAALVAKMMAKEPARRFQEPKEVAQALTPFFKPATTQPSTPGGPTHRPHSQIGSKQPTVDGPAPAQPPVIGPPPLPPAVRPSKTRADGVEWRSLIEFKEAEPLTVAGKSEPAETEPAPDMEPARRPPWLWPSLAVGVLFFAFIIAWIVVVKVKTNNGVIVLENYSNDCTVSVDGDTVTVSWPGGGQPARIEIPPGEHRVKVTRGDDLLLSQEITIGSGGTRTFTVRREALEGLALVGVDRVESNKGAETNPWPGALGRNGQTLTLGFRVAAMSRDCRRVAIVSPSNKKLRVVEAPYASKVFDVEFGEYVWRAEFSPDGKFLGVRSNDGIKMLDATTGKESVRLGGGGPTLAFSPEGERLAAEWGSRLHIWDVETGAELATFGNHANWCWSVVFSPDGKSLASGSGRGNGPEGGSLVGELKVWNVETGTSTDLDGHSERVSGVAFSPDGKRLASASYDRTAKVWDLATKKCLITFGKHQGMVGAVRFSPNGRLIASCGRDLPVRIWDSETGQQVATLKGPPGDYHEDWVIQFSPEGRWIYSGKKSTLKVWETPTGNERALQTAKRVSRTSEPAKVSPTAALTSRSPSVRVPPPGPTRAARNVRGASWTVERDQLIKHGLETGWVTLGDPSWSDYDLTFDACATAGSNALGANFRINSKEDLKCYVLILGLDNKHSISRWSRSGGHEEIQSTAGTLQPHKWYNLRISLRGTYILIELDGELLFALTDEFIQDGLVCLKSYNSSGRFRNIRVSAPNGALLWDGPPDLP